MPADALVMYDGSGLSRYNYVTADTIVAILKRVWNDEKLRGPFVAALPVGGHDGTLDPACGTRCSTGSVQAKTGTIANVRALSGYLRPTPANARVLDDRESLHGAERARSMRWSNARCCGWSAGSPSRGAAHAEARRSGRLGAHAETRANGLRRWATVEALISASTIDAENRLQVRGILMPSRRRSHGGTLFNWRTQWLRNLKRT